MSAKQILFNVQTPPSTVLAIAAAAIGPDQCIRVPTPGLTAAMLRQSTDDMIQWGSSAYWSEFAREFGYIGKQQGGTFPYLWLTYPELTDTWSTSRPVWSTANVSGHGYDHNTEDPATGDVYHRPYNSLVVYKWTRATGLWSALPTMPGPVIFVGSLTWFTGVGLIYADRRWILRFTGGAWVNIASFSGAGGDAHSVSEYNESSNVLIFGAGNVDTAMRKMTSDLVITSIATPSFNLGSSSSQGVLCSDPSADRFIGYQKSTQNWINYRVSNDAAGWPVLTQSTGDGATAQNGMPNLSTSEGSVVAAPIKRYGVTAWLQNVDSQPPAFWLHRMPLAA